jgi:hypothetical protein
MARALLVNMPFSNLRWPNLGPSLLAAALGRRGIVSDTVYLNFDLAEQKGCIAAGLAPRSSCVPQRLGPSLGSSQGFEPECPDEIIHFF